MRSLVRTFTAKREGDAVRLVSSDGDKPRLRWTFTDIAAESLDVATTRNKRTGARAGAGIPREAHQLRTEGSPTDPLNGKKVIALALAACLAVAAQAAASAVSPIDSSGT
jgi:hypothetical protein